MCFAGFPSPLSSMNSFPERSIYLRTDTELSAYNIADTRCVLVTSEIQELTKIVCRAYLDRLSIPELTDLTPSYALLAQLLLAHQLAIPYDSTSLHLKRADWLSDPTKRIVIGTGVGDGMQLGEGNFKRIIERRTGGFCYALNTLFAGLLRTLGFSVGESGARVYMHRGKDPEVVGYAWSSVTHEVLLVGWPGLEERYLVDAGFGGGGNPMYVVRFMRLIRKRLTRIRSAARYFSSTERRRPPSHQQNHSASRKKSSPVSLVQSAPIQHQDSSSTAG